MYFPRGLLTREDRFPMDLPKASNKDSEMEKIISSIAWFIWESVAPHRGMTVAISSLRLLQFNNDIQKGTPACCPGCRRKNGEALTSRPRCKLTCMAPGETLDREKLDRRG